MGRGQSGLDPGLGGLHRWMCQGARGPAKDAASQERCRPHSLLQKSPWSMLQVGFLGAIEWEDGNVLPAWQGIPGAKNPSAILTASPTRARLGDGPPGA